MGDIGRINPDGSLELLDRLVDHAEGTDSFLEVEDAVLDRLPELIELVMLKEVGGHDVVAVACPRDGETLDPGVRWRRCARPASARSRCTSGLRRPAAHRLLQGAPPAAALPPGRLRRRTLGRGGPVSHLWQIFTDAAEHGRSLPLPMQEGQPEFTLAELLERAERTAADVIERTGGHHGTGACRGVSGS